MLGMSLVERNCHCFGAELSLFLGIVVGGASWPVKLRKFRPPQSSTIGFCLMSGPAVSL
jgi:hypothetical protein